MHLIGRKVAELRQEKGWSQQQLAIEAGLHAMTVSEIERQARGTKEPRLATVDALARALGVEPAELLAEDGVPGAAATGPGDRGDGVPADAPAATPAPQSRAS